MNKLNSVLIAVMISFPAVCFANPFLVCDPPAAEEQVTGYEIYQDGTKIATVAAEPDGSVLYDLVDTTPGVYTFTAKAANSWGVSDFSNPTVSPASVKNPSGVRLLP